jgi:hypothetical protein
VDESDQDDGDQAAVGNRGQTTFYAHPKNRGLSPVFTESHIDGETAKIEAVRFCCSAGRDLKTSE